MTSDAVENIILAVDEACTNIIRHAYKSVPDGELIIKTKSTLSRFVVSITDYGNSFEPEMIPEPDLQKYYRQRRVGGLGMYLMKTLMDDVKYVSIPGKYNEVLLSKNIKSSAKQCRITNNLKVKRNLTALVEFSRVINSSLDLNFILNNVLLTCLGKFLSYKRNYCIKHKWKT